jgi:hypothetical protein
LVVDDTVFSLGLEVVVVGWEVEGAAVVKGEVAESVVTVVVIWFHHVLGNIKEFGEVWEDCIRKVSYDQL